MIVLDTSVLIDHLRGRVEARRSLHGAVEDGHVLSASVLTRVEVAAGMRSPERQAVAALFRVIEWHPVTEEIAEDAGDLAHQYHRSHHTIDLVDFVIAATARSYEAQLWTLNTKHFPMVSDLRPPY